MRQGEKLYSAKHGDRRRENSALGSPQQHKCHKTVPRDQESPKTAPVDQSMSEKGDPELEARRNRLKSRFHKLFHVNKTAKYFEYNAQFRQDVTISLQKGRRVPIHIQAAVQKEVKKPIASGHIEKLAEVGEDAFVSPVVTTNKSDGNVKLALYSIELKNRSSKRLYSCRYSSNYSTKSP